MKFTDVLIAIAVPFAWGMGIVIAKPAVAEFPPLLLMALRFLVAALVLVWFVPVPRYHLKSFFLIALVGATLQYGFTFNGLRYLDAGNTALIVQAEVPFLVLIAALVLKERIGLRQIAGILIAFFGIYLLSGQPSLQGQHKPILMVLTGGLLWAVGQVLVRRMTTRSNTTRNNQTISGLQVTAWLAVMATPQLFIASLMMETGHYQLLTESGITLWATVLYLGLVMTVIGYGCWYYVLGKYEAGKVAPFLLLTPLASVLGGVFFLNESLTVLGMVGGSIILLGVALLTIKSNNTNFRLKRSPRRGS